MRLNCNCCDGIYNSFDIHFTSVCDNKCEHCIDRQFDGFGILKPDPKAIAETVIVNSNGLDDVLFLGGEPCLFLDELIECVRLIKSSTNLKVFVTTSVPKTCHDNKEKFYTLIDNLDGINLSTQHHDENVADMIRGTTSKYDRQSFYRDLPNKSKIRINLNVVKPFLHTRNDLENCLRHYDNMGFDSIKLSEIQHGKDMYVSFADLFELKIPSAYSNGCQTYLDMSEILPGFKSKLLLKRSCFLCEESLNASISDGIKMILKLIKSNRNKYGVIYENGTLQGGWV